MLYYSNHGHFEGLILFFYGYYYYFQFLFIPREIQGQQRIIPSPTIFHQSNKHGRPEITLFLCTTASVRYLNTE